MTLGLYQGRQALAWVGGLPSAPAPSRTRKERCELISDTKTKPLLCIIGSFHGVRKDSFIFQHADNLVYMMLYFKIKGTIIVLLCPLSYLKTMHRNFYAA